MTVDEIVAAECNVSVVADIGTQEHPFLAAGRVVEVTENAVHVIGIPIESMGSYYTKVTVFAINEHGYPVWFASGGGPK